ncbi:MAG: 5-formyltetrahydrofolate cyclo-ligase [Clostridia bacterium]|nr:5-formyltetrahydrofolate cyclo-ligase [Clostridia bacterium]
MNENAKKEVRAKLRARREQISNEQLRERSQQIVSRIAASSQLANADLLLLYAPIGKELNLLPLVRVARAKGIPVAFPISDPETCTLTFRILKEDQRLNAGTYNIPEPPADAPIAKPTERTLCILPGLSFTPNGARIGYGKGYYDRFLDTFPGIAVGAVLDAMLCKRLPTEAHDHSVSLLFTERGVIDCNAIVKRKKAATPLATYVNQALNWLRSLQPSKEELSELSHVRVLHLPPALVLCSFLLLILARLIDTALLDRGSEAIGAVLLQILIFVVPSVLYSALRGEKFTKRIRLTLPKPSQLWFCLCILVVMITGSMLASILTGGISSLSGGVVLYNTFSAQSSGDFLGISALIIAYALVPAFCEELVFRAYLCAEYEHLGVAISIAASSLFFAMLHFSFPLFLTYLLLGALLASVLYATRSFFAVFVLHFLYNLFCLFGQPYLSAFYVHAGSNDIFMFCVVTLFLLFSAFATGEARKIYHLYARANLSSAYTTNPPLKQIPKIFLRALASPVTAVCIALWLIMAVINL